MDLCKNELHPASDLASNGHCRGCRRVLQRRRRAAARGKPLCWTAEHPRPEGGCLCPCGEPPPAETWTDWAAVENTLSGRYVPRRLTPAEELSAMRTLMLRHGGGMWEAASWINEHTRHYIPERRVDYLLTEWTRRNDHTPKSVAELLAVEMSQATIPEETAA